jgi:hypothetical protein
LLSSLKYCSKKYGSPVQPMLIESLYFRWNR